jgi:hypothetical protein
MFRTEPQTSPKHRNPTPQMHSLNVQSAPKKEDFFFNLAPLLVASTNSVVVSSEARREKNSTFAPSTAAGLFCAWACRQAYCWRC